MSKSLGTGVDPQELIDKYGADATRFSLASAAGNMPPEEFVRESILNPDAEVAQGFSAGVMPSFEGRLSDKQVQALVDYLLGE